MHLLAWQNFSGETVSDVHTYIQLGIYSLARYLLISQTLLIDSKSYNVLSTQILVC